MSMYEDEIDLRPYIFALLRSWRLILLLVILAIAAAVLVAFTQPQHYEATATLIFTQSRSRLSIAEQFPTTADQANPTSRLDTLLFLLDSDNFSLQTLDQLEEQYPDRVNLVSSANDEVTVEADGDLLNITARSSDPEIAAAVANVWAEQAAKTINQAYTEDLPLASIQEQLVSAELDYRTAQTALQDFIQENKISLLEKQLAEAGQLLDNLAAERAWRIDYYTQRKLDMENLVVQAEALKEQVAVQGSSGAGLMGDALAVLKARAGLFALKNNSYQYMIQPQEGSDPAGQLELPSSPITSLSPSEEGDLSFQLPSYEDLSANSQSFADDIQTLIDQATLEGEAAEEALQALTSEVVGGGENDALSAASARVQELSSLLEQEEARELELTSQRDITWQAFQALAEKETELINGTQASNYVNIAGTALPPEAPAGRGLVLKAGVATLLGLLAGVLWVLASTWWQLTMKELPVKHSTPATDGMD